MRWIVVLVSLLGVSSHLLAADPPATPVRAVAGRSAGSADRLRWTGRPGRCAGDRRADHPLLRDDDGARDRGHAPAGTALGEIRIAGSRLADDGRTLVLATDPHPRQAHYNLTKALEWKSPRDPFIYTLSGVETTWDDGRKDAAPEWSGVLSSLHFDPTAGFRGEPALKERIAKPGRLIMKGNLILPRGKVTLMFNGSSPYTATVNGEAAPPARSVGHARISETTIDSDGSPCELVATVTTGPDLRFSILTRPEVDASKERPSISPADVLLPWVPPSPPPLATVPAAPFELKGGDRKKGEAVFLSEAAKCSACHEVGGKGGKVGPNLDSLKGRDLAEVYYHIAEPSAKILPDFTTYTVARKSGQIVAGVVKAERFDSIRVSDIGAQTTIIPKADIEELRPSSTSTMPVGLPGALGEANMRDLLAFLTTAK